MTSTTPAETHEAITQSPQTNAKTVYLRAIDHAVTAVGIARAAALRIGTGITENAESGITEIDSAKESAYRAARAATLTAYEAAVADAQETFWTASEVAS